MSCQSANILDCYPAAQPPTGQQSNFINPPSLASSINIVNVVFVSLAFLAVVARAFARFKFTAKLGWDDFMCGMAFFMSLCNLVVYFEMTKIGFGRHMWDVPASWVISLSSGQLLNAVGVTYPLLLVFAKLSIILTYFRIFGVDQRLRVVIYLTAAVLVTYYSIAIGIGIGGIVKCASTTALLANAAFCNIVTGHLPVAGGMINTITDIWILILPFPLLAKLQMRWKQKIGVIAVFFAGIAACAASLARFIVIVTHYSVTDTLWFGAYDAICATIEGNILIIVSCVSCFPALFRVTKSYMASTTSSFRRRLLLSRRTPNTSEKRTENSSGAAGDHTLPWSDSELRTAGTNFTYIEMQEPPLCRMKTDSLLQNEEDFQTDGHAGTK